MTEFRWSHLLWESLSSDWFWWNICLFCFSFFNTTLTSPLVSIFLRQDYLSTGTGPLWGRRVADEINGGQTDTVKRMDVPSGADFSEMFRPVGRGGLLWAAFLQIQTLDVYPGHRMSFERDCKDVLCSFAFFPPLFHSESGFTIVIFLWPNFIPPLPLSAISPLSTCKSVSWLLVLVQWYTILNI